MINLLVLAATPATTPPRRTNPMPFVNEQVSDAEIDA